MKLNKANLKVSKLEPEETKQVKHAEKDIEKYIRNCHKDVVELRAFARRKKWEEIRLATVCQAAVEAFSNSFPKTPVPSLRKLLSELKPEDTKHEREELI
jgi:hypothetical protein